MYDWVSIPEIARRYQIELHEAVELLEALDLRHGRGINARPSSWAVQQGVARPQGDRCQWNLLALRALVNGSYPAEGWADYVESMWLSDQVVRSPF